MKYYCISILNFILALNFLTAAHSTCFNCQCSQKDKLKIHDLKGPTDKNFHLNYSVVMEW